MRTSRCPGALVKNFTKKRLRLRIFPGFYKGKLITSLLQLDRQWQLHHLSHLL